MKAQTLTIIGMNRLGASIGLAIKGGPLEMKVIGHDASFSVAQEAEEMGAVDEVRRNLVKAAKAADILVLAVPVSELEETLRLIGDDIQEQTVIIDLAGLKVTGINWAAKYLKQGHYVGARLVLSAAALHDGREDLSGASSDLFNNSIICLMPSARVDPGAVKTAVNFGKLLGAIPYFMDTAEYDSLVQGIETVPGLAAAALFKTVHEAAGWRDILRMAGLAFAQVTQPLGNGRDIAQLALADKNATLRWLNVYLEELTEIRRLIFEDNTEILSAHMEQMEIEREKWLRERKKNEWLEIEKPNITLPGLAQQVFGNLAAPRGPQRDDD